LEFFLAPQEHLIFSFFLMFLILVQKGGFIFFVTHCIISLLPIGWNSFVSRLLQHVILFTYEHVLFNQASCEYVDIIQNIVNKGIDANAKHKNGRMHLETTIMESFQYYSWYSNCFLFFLFHYHNLCDFL